MEGETKQFFIICFPKYYTYTNCCTGSVIHLPAPTAAEQFVSFLIITHFLKKKPATL